MPGVAPLILQRPDNLAQALIVGCNLSPYRPIIDL